LNEVFFLLPLINLVFAQFILIAFCELLFAGVITLILVFQDKTMGFLFFNKLLESIKGLQKRSTAN